MCHVTFFVVGVGEDYIMVEHCHANGRIGQSKITDDLFLMRGSVLQVEFC